jgi:hypothetical protein
VGLTKTINQDCSWYSKGGGGLYKPGEVQNGTEYWLDHPRAPTRYLYEYTDGSIAADKRASYASKKYPWIEMAGMYKVLADFPMDFDAIRVEIPGKQGPGHYIVHWRWGGYYDCVDVDLFDKPVRIPYGEDKKDNKGRQLYKYSRIDQ